MNPALDAVNRNAVYLDHAASTPLRSGARRAIEEFASIGEANASGSHRAARRARVAVDDARELLGTLLGVDGGDIVFTSGGTEADNLAVLGRHAAVGGTVLCSAVEHPAVLECVQLVGGTTIGTDARGVVDLDQLDSLLDHGVLLDHDVSLVSVMTVNNETGAIQPVAEVARRVRAAAPNALVHTDAVQALNWVDVAAIGPEADLLSLSAHKFGGPQGVGLCVVRRGSAVAARQLGGGQERERRSGTLNVVGIVAMAAAAAEAVESRDAQCRRVAALRDQLVDHITGELDGVIESAVPTPGDRLHLAAGHAHLCFSGIESEALLFLLDDAGIYASAASACASGAQHPSHVLEAMGIDRTLATGSLRLSLGHTTTDSDVERAAAAVVAAVRRLRSFPT